MIADAPPAPEKIDRGPTFYETETGGLNEEAMEKAFASLSSPVQRCLDRAMSRVEPFGGHFKLTLRVDREGGTKWVYLSESTLGDRETEKCVLDLARSQSWPRPVGGEGKAEKSFDIDAQAEPAELDEKKVRRAVAQARTDTARCRKGIAGSFLATAYVRRDGRVLAAGVAPPSEKGEDVADCIVDALMKVRFKSHSDSFAKVSFELR